MQAFTRIGPYRLLRPLGRGGTGEVFLAVHERLQQQVALKLLSDEAAFDRQVVSRFLQEGRALAQVQHPGVIRVLGCDRLEDGRVYLAMDYLEGCTLRSWMKGHSPNVDEKLRIASRIAEIMAAVHERGIIHRDLKPENIFVCDDLTGDTFARIRILDFGIAKVPFCGAPLVETQVQTASPSFLGTVAYMAPEQCLDAADVCDRSDVYALGILLFELLTGQTPFVSQDPVEVLAMQLATDPPHLCRLLPELPLDLSCFIMSMLAKHPRERPAMIRCSQILGRGWQNKNVECPLPGLAPLSEAHAEFLFGRSTEVDHLLARCEELRTGRIRWIQLEGLGGVGKTSLVQAGLLPRLKFDGASSTPPWRIVDFRPSTAPVGNLARALLLAMAIEMSRDDLECALRSGAEGLVQLVDRWLEPGVFLLIVIDPLEELFTLPGIENDRVVLDAMLARALDGPESRCRLLTVGRSSMLIRAAHTPLLAEASERAYRYHVQAMSAESIRQALAGMARLVGMRLAEGLADRMVRDGIEVRCGLSLLGHSLCRLWIASQGDVASHDLYEQVGGVSGALAQEAELLLAELGEEGRDRAKWILLSLVQVGRGTSDARRPRTWREALEAAGNDGLAEDVLLQLTGMRWASGGSRPSVRFVVLSDTLDSGDQGIELLHEAMLRSVPTLQGWIEQERLLLERQQDLEALASVWERTGALTEGLPTGSLLTHYCQQEHRSLLSGCARRFIAVARGFDARRTWRRRFAAGMAGLAGAIIIVSMLSARQEQVRAESSLKQILMTTEGVVSDLDWKLSRLPHTLPVRREMLRLVHQNLLTLSTHDQGNLSVRSALIQTIHRLADVAWMNGTLAEATQLLNDARIEIQHAREDWPTEPALVKLLALNHSKHGKVASARGLQLAAFSDFRNAVEVFERFALDHDDPDTRRSLAVSYQELAEAEMATGSAVSAASLLDKAIARLQKNSGEYDRSLLTLVLCERSAVAMSAGEWALAERILREELSLQTRSPSDSDGNGFHRWVRARVHLELATLYLERGQDDDARANARAAQAVVEQLRREEPSNKRYALSFLRGAEITEALARASQDTDRAAAFHASRCDLSEQFRALDPLDARFQTLSCRSKNSLLRGDGKGP